MKFEGPGKFSLLISYADEGASVSLKCGRAVYLSVRGISGSCVTERRLISRNRGWIATEVRVGGAVFRLSSFGFAYFLGKSGSVALPRSVVFGVHVGSLLDGNFRGILYRNGEAIGARFCMRSGFLSFGRNPADSMLGRGLWEACYGARVAPFCDGGEAPNVSRTNSVFLAFNLFDDAILSKDRGCADGSDAIFVLSSAGGFDAATGFRGEEGEYICGARRRGDVWYVAGITEKARVLTLFFPFLTDGVKYAAIWMIDDGAKLPTNAVNPMLSEIARGDKTMVPMLDNGSFVLRLSPK